MPRIASAAKPASATSVRSSSGRWKNTEVNHSERSRGRCWPSRRSRSTIVRNSGSARKPSKSPPRRGAKREIAAARTLPAGAEHPPRLSKCTKSLLTLGEVIERAEQEYQVDRGVALLESPSVSEIGG